MFDVHRHVEITTQGKLQLMTISKGRGFGHHFSNQMKQPNFL